MQYRARLAFSLLPPASVSCVCETPAQSSRDRPAAPLFPERRGAGHFMAAICLCGCQLWWCIQRPDALRGGLMSCRCVSCAVRPRSTAAAMRFSAVLCVAVMALCALCLTSPVSAQRCVRGAVRAFVETGSAGFSALAHKSRGGIECTWDEATQCCCQPTRWMEADGPKYNDLCTQVRRQTETGRAQRDSTELAQRWSADAGRSSH